MRKFLVYLSVVLVLISCAPRYKYSYAFIVGFREDVSAQEAEDVLRGLFGYDARVWYKKLFNEKTSLKEIARRFPQRAKRMPDSLQFLKVPLVYKVIVRTNRFDLNELVAHVKSIQVVEFIQSDLQIQVDEY